MDDYQALIQEAKALLVQKRYDLALETANRAVHVEPRRAMPYIVRAEVLRKLSQHDRALADIAVAIRIEPDRASPFVIRAEILKKRCVFDQAIADATEAIFLDQDNAAAYAIRADCRLAIGDADGAAHDAQELFRIDPTRPPSIPTSVPDATKDDPDTSVRDSKRSGRVPSVRDDSVFADGNAVDRSLKARKAISSDDAAEMLADASGYRPEIIATPLRRIRPPRSRSGNPPLLVGALIGIGALLGVVLMLTMRKQPEVRVQERIVTQPMPTITEVDRPRPALPGASIATDERWEPPVLVAHPEGYFLPLFRGRTIDGPLKDMSNCWQEDRFDNFVLRFEYRLKSHASQPWSGIRLRHGGTSRRLSLVLSEGRSGGLLLDQSLPGVKKPLVEERLDDAHRIIRPAHDADKPFGTWNQCEVVCDRSRTTVAINGEVVNHISNGPSGTGMICLSGFEAGVAFRQIRVMKLNTSTGSSPPQTVTSDPPLNAAKFEGHSYQFFSDVESWHGAKTRCEKMGGHLATIGSRAENDFVLGLARRGIERLGKLDGVWLGATDEVREGYWEWVDGSKSSFTKWDPGQPNNKNGEEHYLLFWLSPGLWVDQPDISKQHVSYFVCEWDRSNQASSSPHVQRLRVSLSEGGGCEVTLDSGKHEGAEMARGDTTLAGLVDGRISEVKEGRFKIVHLFREVTGLSDFARLAGTFPQLMQGISLDRGDGTLMLTPVPAPGEEGKKAILSYPRYLKLPSTITIDLGMLPAASTLIVQVEKLLPDEKLAIRLSADRNGTRLNATWHPLDRKKMVTLFDQAIDPGRRSEHSFQLPPDSIRTTDRVALKLGYYSAAPAEINRVEVEANVVPFFGIASVNPDGPMTLKSTEKGTPAERAGLRQGDVVESIAGKKIRDGNEGVSLLGQTPVGRIVTLMVRRGDKTTEFTLKAE